MISRIMMSSNINIILKKISETKKRYYLINLLNSLVNVLFIIAALTAVFFILTPFLFKYDLYRNLFLTVTAGCALFVVVRYLISPITKRKQDDYFALLLERVTPGINNLIINAVQLGALSMEQVQKYGFRKGFIDLTIDDATKKMVAVSVKDAVSAQSVKRNLVISALLVTVALASFFTNPDFLKDTYTKFLYPYRFLDSDDVMTLDEVERERLNLPEIGDFVIVYNFPEYTWLKEKTVTGSNGDIVCMKGTNVTVTAKSDRPLTGVNIIINDSQKVVATVSGGVDLRFEYTAIETGVYHMEFEGVEYPEDYDHTMYQIVVDEDEFPFIKLIEPKEDFTVDENDDITVAYEAGDDFGVTEINLVIERDNDTKSINVYRSSKNVTEYTGEYTYSLSQLRLTPGETLKVYLETYDNDTISGPKKSVSNERYIDVYSKEKIRREVARMKERLFETFIELLGDHFEKSLVDIDLGSVNLVSANQERMNSQASDLIALLSEIINAIKYEELEEDINSIPLNNMKLNLSDLYDKKDTILKALTSEGYQAGALPVDVAALLSLKEKEIAEAEKDIIFLDNERKKMQMYELMQEGENMLDTQQSLIDMLEQLKESSDLSEAREQLNELLDEMKDIFNSMMEKLSKFPQTLPDEFVNSDSMKDMDIKEDMSLIEQLKESLDANDIEKALELATELLNSMNKMMSSFENSAQEFEQNESTDIMAELD